MAIMGMMEMHSAARGEGEHMDHTSQQVGFREKV